MSFLTATVPDVFSAREIAHAAGARTGDVRALIADGDIGTIDGRFVAAVDAVRAVRILRGATVPDAGRALFSPPSTARRSPGRALLASTALHAAAVAGLVLLTMGVAGAPTLATSTPVRLVFLATPGPGGGGGGGGLRQPKPAPKAEMKGLAIQRSPVPPPRPITARPPDPEPKKTPPPVQPQPVARPVEPPPPAPPAPLPRVVAPVATAPADAHDRAGVVDRARRIRQSWLRFRQRSGHGARHRYWRRHRIRHRSGIRWRHGRRTLPAGRRHYAAGTLARSAA